MIDLFGLPLTSILLFVLAGVLIGYLLWYPDRALQKEKVDGLENRYWRVRGTARERKSRYRELQKLCESRQSEIDRLQSEYDSLLLKHRDADNHLAEARRELSGLRETTQQSEESLTAETRRNESLVQQLQEVLEASAEAEQEQQRQLSTITELNGQLESLQQQYAQKRSECESQTESIAEQQQVIEQLKLDSAAEIEQAQTQLQSQLDEKTAILDRTEKDLVDRCADLDQIRDERDTLKAQVDQLETRSRYVEAEMGRIDEVVRQRDEMAADLQSAADSLGQQRELLEAREVDLGLINEELAHLRHELRTATDLLDQNADTQRELLETVDQRDAKIAKLEEQTEQLESTRQEVTSLTADIATQNDTIAARDETITVLQQDLDAVERKLAESITVHTQTMTALDTAANDLTQSRRGSQQLQTTIETLQTEAYELRLQVQTMHELETSVDSLTEQFESVSTQLTQLQTELTEKNQFIDRQNSDLRKLAEEIETLEPLQEQLATAEASVVEHRTHRTELQTKCDAQQQQIEQLQSQAALVPELQDDLQQTVTKLEFSREETAGSLSRIGELKRQLDQLRTRYNELQTSESSIRIELDAKLDELQATVQRNDQLQLSHQNLSDRCEQLEHLENRYIDLQDSEAQLRVQLQTKLEELEELVQSRDRLELSHQSLTDRCSQLEQDAESTASAWTHERETANEEIERQRGDIETLQGKVDEQEQSLTDLYRDLSERCGLHETAVREVSQWRQRLQQELDRQQELTQKNDDLESQVVDLTQRLGRIRTELEDSLDANEQAHEQIRNLRRRRAA